MVNIPTPPAKAYKDAAEELTNRALVLASGSGRAMLDTGYGTREAYGVNAYGLDESGHVVHLGAFNIFWGACLEQLNAVDADLEAGELMACQFVKDGRRYIIEGVEEKTADYLLEGTQRLLDNPEPTPPEDAPF